MHGVAGPVPSSSVATPSWLNEELMAWWPMDEASGPYLADASGHGNEGTLSNAHETGVAQSGSSMTALTDPANASLATADLAYDGMIVQITSGQMAGTQRMVTGYAGTSRSLSVSPLPFDPTGATFVILHQVGGRFGNSLAFDGDNDFVTAGSVATLGTPRELTLSAWVRPKTSSQPGNPEILARSSGPYSYRMRFMDGGTVRFNTYGASDTDLTSISALAASRWNHVVMTYDGSVKRVFLNGMLDIEEPTTGNMDPDTAYLYIGGFSGSEFFAGQIDDVRIYQKALSTEQALELNGWGPGPVGYWPFDEGTGPTIGDASGNGNDGVLLQSANVPTRAPGRFGGGLVFDGVDDLVKIDSANTGILNAGMHSFTLMAWFNTDDANQGQALVVKGDTVDSSCVQPGNQGYYFGIYVGKLYFKINTGSPQGCLQFYGTTDPLPSGTWHHAAASVDRMGKLVIYLDGAMESATDVSPYTNSVDSPGSLSVGGYPSNTTYKPFAGTIDELRIYDYALTDAQILTDAGL
jgi:hypothetical protein